MSIGSGLWQILNLHLGFGEPAGCPGAQQPLGLCRPFGNMAQFKLECGHSLGQLQIAAALRVTGRKRNKWDQNSCTLEAVELGYAENFPW